MKEAGFFTGFTSTWDMGRNALTPMSTMKPPFTSETTGPSTGVPSSRALSILCQIFTPSTLCFESVSRPSLTSLLTIMTSTSSPTLTAGVPDSSRNSLKATLPSDLRPTSTITLSEFMPMTWPVRTLPS